MSIILDCCPFYEEATQVDTATGPVLVRAYQIIVWIGISPWRLAPRPIPAILDTGHSHNLSIRTEHLNSWAGLGADELRIIGRARVNQQLVELRDATVAIYLNPPGKRDARRDLPPYELTLSEGIAVHRIGDLMAPRLPLLGLRAMVKNQLQLQIDGIRREISLTSD